MLVAFCDGNNGVVSSVALLVFCLLAGGLVEVHAELSPGSASCPKYTHVN